jgi:hypothetical protein
MKNKFDNLSMIEQFEVAVKFMRMKILKEYEIDYSEDDNNFMRGDFLEFVMQDFIRNAYKYVPRSYILKSEKHNEERKAQAIAEFDIINFI